MLCHLFVSADIVKKITCDVTITEFDVHILWGFLTCLDFWAFYLFILNLAWVFLKGIVLFFGPKQQQNYLSASVCIIRYPDQCMSMKCDVGL